MKWDGKRTGDKNPNWKGGVRFFGGYKAIWTPGHPHCRVGGYVAEHVLIAEKALGKYLPPDAVVHHANGKKSGGTLVICENTAYHSLLHRRMRALKECGHANWRKCNYCKQYDDPNNLINHNESSMAHRSCRSEYHKSYYLRKKEKGD